MRLDFATLAFNAQLRTPGGTPNWATSLGQGREHRINADPNIDEIIRGMIYCGVPVTKVTSRMGRGGNVVSGNDPDFPIVLSAVFNTVYVNDVLIENGRFLLLVSRDLTGVHAGRLKFKYGPTNTYNDAANSFSNQDFYGRMLEQLGLAPDACWFATDINVRNQNELVIKAIIVKPDGPMTYHDMNELRTHWGALAPYALQNAFGDADGVRIGENLILYGIPGCGKSHSINVSYLAGTYETQRERVVFHPDYTYSDFVGQILPQNADGHITYPFTPGPFTRILKKAVNDRENNYYLIIEELNRGNAPAIFGEVFQLLDRRNGESEFGINNAEIAKEVYDDPTHQVKIPSNLFIIATMNTADQNVFTLDTAFKRRWNMKCVPNDLSQCAFADSSICGSDVKWGSFVNAVNEKIIQYAQDSIGSEDKRLGAFFVHAEDIENRETFSDKVLMYLWNDAFKYDRDKIFKPQYTTLEKLLEGFRNDLFDVFNDIDFI